MINSKYVATVAIAAMVLALGAAGIVTMTGQIAKATAIIIGPPADRMKELPPCVDDIKQNDKVCERVRFG